MELRHDPDPSLPRAERNGRHRKIGRLVCEQCTLSPRTLASLSNQDDPILAAMYCRSCLVRAVAVIDEAEAAK